MNDKLRVLQLKLKNAKPPIMLVGDAAKLFKERSSKNIENPENEIELNRLIKEYKIANKPLVFEFSSFLSNTSVLNCIKEYSNLLILTEDTNLSLELLTYIRTLVKFSDKSSSKLQGAKISQEDWKVEDDKSNVLKFMAKVSPEWYYYKNKYNMTKYIDLFSSD